ncbi:hypothetical protein IEQ34_019474 [Dendrobium chrysotoxum]|uniref:Uncharacterized protein n=1 Tax=Dendrobium chrysotoxum TaxID=161865 RepID=A0AAV7FRD5_DENCH|nr:hypothetical protein IEQ34_019474 [Dendrobium chrysotoxum]
MLSSMIEMAKNVDFILLPKGISNARLKSHWEKRKTKKQKPSHQANQTVEPTTQPTFTNIPECLTEEFIQGRTSPQPSVEYRRLMMGIIKTEKYQC